MRLALCCGVTQLRFMERSIPGARTRDHRNHRGSLLHVFRNGTGWHVPPGIVSTARSSHLTTTLGGGRLQMQPAFLPWVFTGSGVPTTTQRLWPGAPQAAMVHGPRDSVCCTAQASGRSDRHCHPPRRLAGQEPFGSSECPCPRTSGRLLSVNLQHNHHPAEGDSAKVAHRRNMAQATPPGRNTAFQVMNVCGLANLRRPEDQDTQ